MTQIYDGALEPSGISANQFDLLAHLNFVFISGEKAIAIGALAQRIVMHPTTVNRDLKALISRKLVAECGMAEDRRVRGVCVTAKGRKALAHAIPYWRRAQRQIETALGGEAAERLNAILDEAYAKVQGPG
jgi:DNA-binding MarR family transcriptional regulator